jgi:hypothetical protein
MTPTQENLEPALLDVRKAYRLLHDYQRMSLDAVNFIGKQLGLDYAGGHPKFSAATPRPGKGKLDYGAWDWLNMMCYEFHFHREFDDEWAGFSVLLISDTGWHCAEDEKLERTNPAGFLPPEQSSTKVGFLMTANDWPDMKFMVDKAAMKTFIENDGQLPEEITATGMIGKCCDFSRLASEDATTTLINELVTEANRAGIKLERVAKGDKPQREAG